MYIFAKINPSFSRGLKKRFFKSRVQPCLANVMLSRPYNFFTVHTVGYGITELLGLLLDFSVVTSVFLFTFCASFERAGKDCVIRNDYFSVSVVSALNDTCKRCSRANNKSSVDNKIA